MLRLIWRVNKFPGSLLGLYCNILKFSRERIIRCCCYCFSEKCVSAWAAGRGFLIRALEINFIFVPDFHNLSLFARAWVIVQIKLVSLWRIECGEEKMIRQIRGACGWCWSSGARSAGPPWNAGVNIGENIFTREKQAWGKFRAFSVFRWNAVFVMIHSVIWFQYKFVIINIKPNGLMYQEGME